MSDNFIAVFLGGFEIQSNGSFNITLETSIQNKITFYTNISTDLYCLIMFIKTVHLFCDLTQNQRIYVYGYDIVAGTGSTVISIPPHFDSFGSKIIGLMSWAATGTSPMTATSFKYTAAESKLVFELDSSVHQSFVWSYIFIALKGCNPLYPLITVSGNCTSNCEPGQTQAPSNRQCRECIPPCVECSTSATMCLSCVPGYVLQSGGNCEQKRE